MIVSRSVQEVSFCFSASSRWLVRGLRPGSVQWPRQEKGRGTAPSPVPRGRWRNSVHGTSAVVQTRPDQPRLAPEEALTAAQERVLELERPLEVLGPSSRCSRTL